MTTNSSLGYRQKPKLIYLVAVLLMLTPFGNLIWSLKALKVSNWYHPSVWFYWSQYVQWPTWILLGLIFASGLSLLFVRKWSWTFSLVTMAIITIYDIVMWHEFRMMGTAAVVAMIVCTLGFSAFMFFTEFRVPYLNPRVRWWETSPRYRVDLPVVLNKTDSPATLVDISRTGLLIEWPVSSKIPDIEGEMLITLPTQASLPTKIMRRTERGYGLMFASLSREQRKSVQHFIETLAEDPTKLQR
jgi:hypothetical protein